jgi:hypothetical protein
MCFVCVYGLMCLCYDVGNDYKDRVEAINSKLMNLICMTELFFIDQQNRSAFLNKSVVLGFELSVLGKHSAT